MEFQLMLDRIVPLGYSGTLKKYRGDSYNEKCTYGYDICASRKLVQDLELHGVPTNLVVDQQLPGPTLGAAFLICEEDLDVEEDESLDESDISCCIAKSYFKIEGLNKFVSSIVTGAGWDIKILLDLSRIGPNDIDGAGFAKPCVTSGRYEFAVNPEDVDKTHIRPLHVTQTKDAEIFANWWTDPDAGDELTVSLSLVCCPIVGLDPEVPYQLAFTQKMLTEELFADVTIVAGNGSEIKAHRSVLGAQSSVFAAMFQHGMEEARTGVLELRGMSEESIRALLEFLYVWKRTAAEENPLVCVELLEAGHKYDILPMENCMRNILLKKKEDWFTPEAVLNLILFVKDTQFEDLHNKTVQLLKSMEKEVKNLTDFRKLCDENAKSEELLFNNLTTF